MSDIYFTDADGKRRVVPFEPRHNPSQNAIEAVRKEYPDAKVGPTADRESLDEGDYRHVDGWASFALKDKQEVLT
jgi:hypothetical protein